MTFPLVVLLIFVASVLLMYRHRRSAFTLYAVTTIICFAVGCGWVPHVLLTRLQAPYAVPPQPLQWGSRNAIVLLGMGLEKIADFNLVEINSLAYGRLARTASAYRSCKQSGKECKVIVSGGDVRGYGTSEAAVYGDYLTRLGVDAADLMPESRSMNTWQNAQFTGELLRSASHPFDQVWLISSAVHLTRSVMYFTHFGINVTPIRGDYLTSSVFSVPTAYNFMLTDIALHEYLGVVRSRVYTALGWNGSPAHREF